jgi:hypothetical protein
MYKNFEKKKSLVKSPRLGLTPRHNVTLTLKVDRLCGLVVRVPGYRSVDVLWFLWGTKWIYVCYVEEIRSPLWSSGQSSWLQIQGYLQVPLTSQSRNAICIRQLLNAVSSVRPFTRHISPRKHSSTLGFRAKRSHGSSSQILRCVPPLNLLNFLTIIIFVSCHKVYYCESFSSFLFLLPFYDQIFSTSSFSRVLSMYVQTAMCEKLVKKG